MFYCESSLDDLMYSVLSELLHRPFNVNSSRSKGLGSTSEIIGAMLHLENPRCRLSRDEAKGTVFSALGELLWYLSTSNQLDFIKYYIRDYKNESEDGLTIYGAYGPRLFAFRNSINQIDNVIKLLKRKAASRRAVIQLFDAIDLVDEHKEIPCTCTLQFFVREGKLELFTSMRSNDAYKGLPHDVFAFTMIQEIVARSLNVNLGKYHHAVGSLHLYENDATKAREYLDAGYQSTKHQMPAMPNRDPWEEVKLLLSFEKDFRDRTNITPIAQLDDYWGDLAKLLQLYSITKKNPLTQKDILQMEDLKNRFGNSYYETYILKKLAETKLKVVK